MTKDKQIELIEKQNKKALNLIIKKGGDYANDEDVLLSFKVISKVQSLLNVDTRVPIGSCMFFILLKIQRLANLIFTEKQPNNESIEDTIVDLGNYVDLLNCLWEEANPNLLD